MQVKTQLSTFPNFCFAPEIHLVDLNGRFGWDFTTSFLHLFFSNTFAQRRIIKQQLYLYQYKLLISIKYYFASCVLPFYNILTNLVFLTLFSYRAPESSLPMKASQSKHRSIIIAVSIIIVLLIIIAAVVSAIVITVIQGKFMALTFLLKMFISREIN